MTEKKSRPQNSFAEKLKRIDSDEEIRNSILKLCRLKENEIWEDKINGHRVGVLDATLPEHLIKIFGKDKASLIINDPPYNVAVGNKNTKNLSKLSSQEYIDFSRKWVSNALSALAEEASLYVWMGADQNDEFQPLPDFMIMMREFDELKSRSMITMRNQRGYGTQHNWMAVRQELLYYVKGEPPFNVMYTDIPKVLKGYYKQIKGKRTENLERSKSEFIRPGNVWVDVQQVFYRMEENVPGAYAQKPLKAIKRIINSSSKKDDVVLDMFSHSGTTLIAAELTDRKCYCFDIDPIFAELTIRRLENLREIGKTGWQWRNPFPELD